MIPDWAKEMNCAVTVCDKEGSDKIGRESQLLMW